MAGLARQSDPLRASSLSAEIRNSGTSRNDRTTAPVSPVDCRQSRLRFTVERSRRSVERRKMHLREIWPRLFAVVAQCTQKDVEKLALRIHPATSTRASIRG